MVQRLIVEIGFVNLQLAYCLQSIVLRLSLVFLRVERIVSFFDMGVCN